MNFEALLKELCDIPTVSGCEVNAHEKIKALVGAEFDEVYSDSARNLILVKKSRARTRNIKPRIIIDAHLDEVGMVVSGIDGEGLIRVAPVGGIDRKILPAAEVFVYGREKLYGVIPALPVHLRKKDYKLPEWSEVRIDIGYSRDEAERVVEIGDIVTFASSVKELLNGRITGRGFDDKACAAAAICGVISASDEELCYDVYVVLSSGEEIGRGGAFCAAADIKPEYAIICDVGFATQPGIDDGTSKMGTGVIVSLSAATDRRITRRVIDTAKENGLGYTVSIEPISTGTNADCIAYANEGVPAAVVGIPIGGMHTYGESLALSDAETLAELVKKYVTTPEA